MIIMKKRKGPNERANFEIEIKFKFVEFNIPVLSRKFICDLQMKLRLLLFVLY